MIRLSGLSLRAYALSGRRTRTVGLTAAILAVSSRSSATELVGRVEPFAAIPLTSPQAGRFSAGGGTGLGGGISLVPYLEWQVEAAFLALAQGKDGSSMGTAFAVGTGPRIARPRSEGWSPWIEADVTYVSTGTLDRVGLSFAGGVTFPVFHSKVFAVGPFVRGLVILQPATAGFNDTDARIFMGGITLEWSAPASSSPATRSGGGAEATLVSPDRDKDGDGLTDRIDRCPEIAGPASNDGCPVVASASDRDKDGVIDTEDRCPDTPGLRDLRGCPDRDNDGVADMEDECPSVAGPLENRGCPIYRLVTILGDKVELGERVFFAFGTTSIMPSSFPLLTQVAAALKDRDSLKIRIEGHADSMGGAGANMALSQQRVEAVRQYLIAQGIASDRISSASYGDTLPVDTNATPEGRERNRRVEVVVTGGTPAADPNSVGAPPADPKTVSQPVVTPKSVEPPPPAAKPAAAPLKKAPPKPRKPKPEGPPR